MLKIRLTRTGARKKPKYRIVVADTRSKRDGKFTEIIGNYDPMKEPAIVNLKKERYQHWLSLGAKPTQAITHLAKYYDKTN